MFIVSISLDLCLLSVGCLGFWLLGFFLGFLALWLLGFLAPSISGSVVFL